MPSKIYTNVTAVGVTRNLNNINILINKDLQQLSSGLRINSGADDPSGLSISERMKAQINGLQNATSNTNNAITLIQTADGALSTINTVLLSMDELAVLSASGTADAATLLINMDGITQHLASITDTIGVTQFNGITLLDGTANVTFQIGAKNTVNDQLSLLIAACDNVTTGISLIDVRTQVNAQAAMVSLASAISYIASVRATIGTTQNVLENTQTNLGLSIENVTTALSNITDADMAALIVDYTKNSVLAQAAQAMLNQANQQRATVLTFLKGL